MYKELTFQIQGVTPLLMHNGRLANPLDAWTKEIKKCTSKRTKTEEDIIEISRLEWFGSLYLKDKRPCIPGEVMEAGLCVAAKRNKLGKKAKAGLIVPDDAILVYDGPTDLDQLWEDERFRLMAMAVVQQHRVLRTHPRFSEWKASVRILYDPTMLNPDQIVDTVKILGAEVGIGDWRPRFGRFTVTSFS